MNFKQVSQEWRLDWGKFAYEVLNVRLDSQMEHILYDVQHNKKVSVCSGTSRGKDFLGSVASMCALYLTPSMHGGVFQPSQVLCTGPTGRQAKTIMWGEISSRFNGSRLLNIAPYGFNPGRLANGSILFDMPRSANEEQIKMFAQIEKWRLDVFKAQDFNAQAWQGFHAEHFMAVITEAAGIDKRVFDGIEGCLQNDSRLLIVFNPDINHGEAYNSCKDPQYKFHRLSSFTAPNIVLRNKYLHGGITLEQYEKERIPSQVDHEWVDERVHKAGWTMSISEAEKDPSKHDFEWDGKWYRPQPLFLRKVMAIHVEGVDDTLIPMVWIELAMERWKYRSAKGGNLGVDVAGQGRDTTQTVWRDGNYCSEFSAITCDEPALIHANTAGVIANEAQHYEAVFIDTIGEGAGVYSMLFSQEVPNVVAFKNSHGAKSLKDSATNAVSFLNMRAYTFWELRDWLNPAFNQDAMLPYDDQLKEELASVQYITRPDGRIQIEPKEKIKERLGVSPDKSDALAQTFAPAWYYQVDKNKKEKKISGIGMFR